MKIAIFHGYELIGSGSNQSTRYLARALALDGQEVHVLCREPAPESVDFADRALRWDEGGEASILFERDGCNAGSCTLHVLPLPPTNAVYITDTQRPGNVKAFQDLSDAELEEYHRFVAASVEAVLRATPIDVFHANHVIYQPVIAAEVCPRFGIPFIIYPRGSAIEYTLRNDDRYVKLAGEAVLAADGLIIGNAEVRDRIRELYPEHDAEILAKTEIVGLGVDTAAFRPVPREERAASVAKLAACGPFAGKPAALSHEMHRRLDAGDFSAVGAYRNAYDLKKPDADLTQKLGRIPLDGKLLIYVGALISGKGVQTLIAAMPSVLKRHPDAHLIVVGSGISRELFEALVHAISSRNESLLDHLVARGFELDPVDIAGEWRDVKAFLDRPGVREELFEHGKAIADHVHFLGRLDHDLLRFLFPCCDVGLFPSIIPEAYANVLFESLANGVFPMVSYFSGLACGIDELETHLGADLVDLMKIPVDDDERIFALTEQLNGLLADGTAAVIAPRLRKVAEENYDWSGRAKQMVAAYGRFVRRHRKA